MVDLGLSDEALLVLVGKLYHDEPPKGLESKETLDKRRVEQLKGVVLKYSESFEKGYQLFLHHPDVHCKEKLKELSTDKGVDLVNQYLLGGHYCLGTPLGLTDEDYSALYKVACASLESDPRTARDLYTALIFLNFTFVEFWIGLALATSKLHDIPETEFIYKCAIFLNPYEPAPYFYYGNFLKVHGDVGHAARLLAQGEQLQSKSE